MFQLDPTLAADSHAVAEDEDLIVRMIDDARFPWVLLVPKWTGARELHDLPSALFEKTMRVTRSLGNAMKAEFRADKINTAAIGNMVPQLHVHIVARRQDDAAWPAPVWGFESMVRMNDEDAEARITLIREGLRLG